MGPANTLSQPMQFSTKPYDDKTGLSYYGYRFYVPSLGRWLTRDPIGEAGGINLYGFVENNPINAIDPDGLFVFPLVIPLGLPIIGPGVSGAVGAAIGIAAGIGAGMAMSKGGKQNIANEWSDEARRQPDPCKWLDEQYNKPENKNDKCARRKIKQAQQYLGCRPTGGDY